MRLGSVRIIVLSVLTVFLIHFAAMPAASAERPRYQSYVPKIEEIEKHKAIWDDPRRP